MCQTYSNLVLFEFRPCFIVAVCGIMCLLLNGCLAQGKSGRKFTPRVTLNTPRGFSVSLDDARDVRQLHIYWNLRRPYDRASPYSSTDFANVSFNDGAAAAVTVGDAEVLLQAGDSVFYWLLVTTADWSRFTVHKLNFWVKLDGETSLKTPVRFSETYYRDYTNYCTDE